jgi:hypothetical protein
LALAEAHEAGDAAAVRILHAVLGLLSATPPAERAVTRPWGDHRA